MNGEKNESSPIRSGIGWVVLVLIVVAMVVLLWATLTSCASGPAS